MIPLEDRVLEHAREVSNKYGDFIGCFLYGSQNYRLDNEESDVDTKLIVAPSFKDVVMNKKGVSFTRVRKNNEHTDVKDVRIFINILKKQNVNYIETLFTNWKIISSTYYDEWNKLIVNREKIARYDRLRTVRAMAGMASQKYYALEHPYPNKIKVIKKYGYDPKQLLHLKRLEDFIKRYIADESYQDCLLPSDPGFLHLIKIGTFDLIAARAFARMAMNEIEALKREAISLYKDLESDKEVEELLDEVKYNIMKIAIERDLK